MTDIDAIYVHSAELQTGITDYKIQLPPPKWFLHCCVKHKHGMHPINFLGLASQ